MVLAATHQMPLICCWVVLFAVLSSTTIADQRKIGAFNIRIFGKAKMKKTDVVQVLIQVVQRYDILLVQEIRDKSGKAIQDLLTQVNNNGPYQYDHVISGRLGRTSSKEQYAYFYRNNSGIELTASYQYPDNNDVFQREPYAVYFKLANSEISDLALVALHTDPDDVPEELDAVPAVLNTIQTQWDQCEVILLGDLNADCRYFTETEKLSSLLRTDDYKWLIADSVDTTVYTTDCAYDRFVVSRNFSTGKVANPQVFNFMTEYDLTLRQAKRVSDHYPIELDILMDEDDTTNLPDTTTLPICLPTLTEDTIESTPDGSTTFDWN